MILGAPVVPPGYITTAVLDRASDWTKDGNAYRPLEGGRSLSTVFEDFLGQADFDPVALLPEYMKDSVDPMALMLALNEEIRSHKEIGG